MRVYKQTSLLTQLLKIGLGLEIGFLGVSYLLFRRLNESPEKRYEYRNYPFLLECYYKIDESLGHGERRRSDQEHWKKHFQGK